MRLRSVWAVVAGVLFIVGVTTLVLGVVGTVLGVVGVIVTWNLGLGPRRYPIALAVLAIPQSWAGGTLYQALSGKPRAA